MLNFMLSILGRSGSWVFFFQAEDGIRYLTVTGVQTCALPISPATKQAGIPPLVRAHGEAIRVMMAAQTERAIAAWPKDAARLVVVRAVAEREATRSEERRVGEEGRSRWAPDHLKKKKKSYTKN